MTRAQRIAVALHDARKMHAILNELSWWRLASATLFWRFEDSLGGNL